MYVEKDEIYKHSNLKEKKTTVNKHLNSIYKQIENNMGFVPNSMYAMGKVPALLSNFTMLSGLLIGNPKKVNLVSSIGLVIKNIYYSLKFLREQNRVPLYLKSLVGHISSYAAGCKYCQAHTITNAKHYGASEAQLNNLWQFETNQAFNDKERTALRFAFAAGNTPNAVTKNHFAELNKHFTETQIIELGAVISLYGFLNRWNDSFATVLENAPLQAAEKHLSPKGWEIGKH